MTIHFLILKCEENTLFSFQIIFKNLRCREKGHGRQAGRHTQIFIHRFSIQKSALFGHELAEARSWELHPAIQAGWQGLSCLSLCLLLSRVHGSSNGDLDLKLGTLIQDMGVSIGSLTTRPYAFPGMLTFIIFD